MEVYEIVLLVIGISLGIIVLGAALFLFLFIRGRSKVRRGAEQLRQERDYLHSLLTGKIAKNISRIELVSRTNLLYVEVLNSLRKRYQPLLEQLNTECRYQIDELQDRIKDREYPGLKRLVQDAKTYFNVVKGDILALEKEIDDIIRPEEEARSNALMVKELYRDIKKIYNEHESDLSLVKETFKNISDNVNNRFNKIDSLIECAEYSEVNRLIDEVNTFLHELLHILEELPKICLLLNVVLPTKINEVNQIYDDMEKQDFPLRHLRVKSTIVEIDKSMLLIGEDVKILKTKGVFDALNAFSNKLDEFKDEFNKERFSKNEFDKIYGGIADIADNLHKRYIRLSKDLHEVRRYYIISEEFEQKLAQIKIQIDEVSLIKRNLDTYIHSSTGLHYSLLLEKTKQLEEQAILCNRNFTSFSEYETSLKSDAEKAFATVNAIFFKLFEVKRKIKGLVSQKLRETYDNRVDKCYAQLLELSDSLKTIPIEIDKVNALTNRLTFLFEDLASRIDSDYKIQNACELNFVSANVYRGQFSEVNRQMINIENSFLDGEYSLVYKELISILTKNGATSYASIDENK